MELEKLIKELSSKESKIYSIEFIKINYTNDSGVSVTLCSKDCAEEFTFNDIQEPNFD